MRFRRGRCQNERGCITWNWSGRRRGFVKDTDAQWNRRGFGRTVAAPPLNSGVSQPMFQGVTTDLRVAGFHHSSGWERGAALKLAYFLGQPVGESRDPAIVRMLSPQVPSEALTNTLSSRYGMGPFPFHTESAYWRHPSRFVVLYCVHPGSGERPTLLKDSAEWDLSSRKLQILTHGAWKSGGSRRFVCAIGSRCSGRLRLRFDLDCMKPLNRAAREASEIVGLCMQSQMPQRIEWHPGDLLVIDNFRILHARGAAGAPDQDRILERVLVVE